MGYLLQQLLNGLHSAALYALLAFGYALVYGVTRRANFAHGALFAFSGQMLILAGVFGYRVFWLTLPAAIAFGAVVAFALTLLASRILGQAVFRPLAAHAPNAFLVATLGALIVLLELGRNAADGRDWWLPPVFAEPVVVADAAGFAATLTRIQLADIAAAAIALALGAFAIARLPAGRSWRAVSDDPLAAALTGVDAGGVVVGAALVGGGLAALAGGMAALQLGNIDFGTGLVFAIKVVFVAALGGHGRPLLAAAGAVMVGFAEALWTAYFAADWRDAAILGGLAALLILRPGRSEPA